MRQLLICLIILNSGCSLVAQEKEETFPYHIIPGQDSITLPVFSDTIWVLTNNQYNNALITGLKQKIDSSLVFLLDQKSNLMNKLGTEKDSLIALNRRGYIHYRDLWAETDRKLEEAEIKNANQWKLGIYGFCVGVGLSSLLFIAVK